jgi:hypothetical protein
MAIHVDFLMKKISMAIYVDFLGKNQHGHPCWFFG